MAAPMNAIELIRAAAEGKLDEVMRLAATENINYKDTIGTRVWAFRISALSEACFGGHVDVARFLLGAGASILSDADDDEPVLNFAIREGRLPMVKLLLQYGADINKKHESAAGPIHIAIHYDEENSLEMLHVLIAAGGDVNEVDARGRTPLFHAHRVDMAKALVHAGADVNKKDNRGEVLLNYAVRRGRLPVVKVLLQNNANVLRKDVDGFGPIHTVASIDHQCYTAICCLEILHVLIAAGGDVNEVDNTGRTPIFYAADSNRLGAVKALVDAGADVKKIDNEGRSVLFGCSFRSNEVLHFLIDAGADLNVKNVEGLTALHFYQLIDALEPFRTLVIAGADVNTSRTSDGDSLLHSGAGSEDEVKLLLEHGANVNATNNRGETPIEIATNFPSSTSTSLLFDYGSGLVQCRKSDCACEGTVLMCVYARTRKIVVDDGIQNGFHDELDKLQRHIIRMQMAGLPTGVKLFDPPLDGIDWSTSRRDSRFKIQDFFIANTNNMVIQSSS